MHTGKRLSGGSYGGIGLSVGFAFFLAEAVFFLVPLEGVGVRSSSSGSCGGKDLASSSSMYFLHTQTDYAIFRQKENQASYRSIESISV